jgi:hypothetical protein
MLLDEWWVVKSIKEAGITPESRHGARFEGPRCSSGRITPDPEITTCSTGNAVRGAEAQARSSEIVLLVQEEAIGDRSRFWWLKIFGFETD